MRTLALAALALSIVATPAALAVEDIGSWVTETSSGRCEPGDPRTETTSVEARGASASGSSWCNSDPESGATTVDTIAVSAGGSTLVWAGSSTGGCALYLQSGEDTTMAPVCPARPPNPGWGHLLP